MRPIGVLARVLPVLLMSVLLACGPKSPSAVVVFAAASLKPAFTQIGQQFKTDNPGSSVEFDFAGSSELATRLTQGATADVFASADTAQMETVAKAGLLAGDPGNFASNTLAIVTAPDNPQRVTSFADLARPGLRVVICQQPVPCGSATHRIEDSTGVHLNPVSEELSVTDVLNKVTTGQADAGLVYVTDAQSAANKVGTVNFPEATGAVNVYPIALLKKAPQPTLAQKFVTLVTSPAGQKVLAQFGFQKPQANP
ncbi:molybdate ABC transporter substrate-binding protein [Mycobacterium sp. 852002-51163_SCH5372311]|uniref:molybdate ABC transporter substrate-binding protein n=1 Tax=Mycobacterium sp. 852002-51163_SCH5372311 TaxID=1834097 RepID=UPI00080230C6|nr:molybdate ABC transporter substrate-binding protein [Mycobacterium sp. 852002-51163_SCH5372311]OBF89465.1 molybdate ABC transporter substrate-binding protein [Mycobacterium sp. 852002-51163_SCH5372311]